jgi:hypothetical protein
VVRVADGSVLSKAVPPAGALSPHVRGEALYVAGPASLAALKLPPAAVPGMPIRSLWEKKLASRPVCAPLALDGQVCVLGEKGLVVFDASTGSELASETLAPNGQVRSELLLAGAYLLATNVGPDCRTVVLRQGQKLAAVWEFAVPGGSQTPFFIARNLYVRSGAVLFALGGEAPHKPEPFAVPPTVKPAEGYAPPAGAAVVPFESNEMPRRWLIAGPFTPKSLDEDFLKTLGGRQQARPAPGQAVKFAGGEASFQALDAKHLWQDAKFTGGYEAVDVLGAIGGNGDSTLYLSTVVDNDQPRYAELLMLTPKGDQWNTKERLDYLVWIGGQAVKEGEVIRLEQGKIPVVIQVALAKVPSGKVWFAPRLVDKTPAYAGLQERFEKADAVWQAYQKVKDQLFTLKP